MRHLVPGANRCPSDLERDLLVHLRPIDYHPYLDHNVASDLDSDYKIVLLWLPHANRSSIEAVTLDQNASRTSDQHLRYHGPCSI